MEKEAEMRQTAMNWLAKRDLSRKEMAQRLLRRFSTMDANPTLDWLEQKGFLNDARFADVFFRSRLERGHGPLRIRQEMQQKGLSAELIEAMFDQYAPDWFELAKQVHDKKFSAALGDATIAAKDKQKHLRYLQYRGFDMEQIQYACPCRFHRR